jgi:hypothetical protein
MWCKHRPRISMLGLSQHTMHDTHRKRDGTHACLMEQMHTCKHAHAHTHSVQSVRTHTITHPHPHPHSLTHGHTHTNILSSYCDWPRGGGQSTANYMYTILACRHSGLPFARGANQHSIMFGSSCCMSAGRTKLSRWLGYPLPQICICFGKLISRKPANYGDRHLGYHILHPWMGPKSRNLDFLHV